MYPIKVFVLCLITALLSGKNAIGQPYKIPTNFAFLKTNIVNDTNNLAAAYKAYRQGKIGKDEIMAVTLATLNDEPITFLGELRDQFNQPVENATVKFDVRIYNGFESTVQRGEVVSDSNGFFKISGFHGESLGMMPNKQGFAIATANTYFKYSRLDDSSYIPDRNKPLLIKMWRAHGAEPLVGVGAHYKLHYTNTPIFLDLIARKIVPDGGDLKITVIRPNGIISGLNPQPWSVKFEAVEGGLMNSSKTERITYFAPEIGFEPVMTISNQDRSVDGGTDSFGTGFYMKSRNGQVYTKLGFRFRINSSPNDLMYIELSGVANTNFSRNWEGASGTFLKPD